MRFTYTRAVRGFSGFAIHSASSLRPLVCGSICGGGPYVTALRKPRGTELPS